MLLSNSALKSDENNIQSTLFLKKKITELPKLK